MFGQDKTVASFHGVFQNGNSTDSRSEDLAFFGQRDCGYPTCWFFDVDIVGLSAHSTSGGDFLG